MILYVQNLYSFLLLLIEHFIDISKHFFEGFYVFISSLNIQFIFIICILYFSQNINYFLLSLTEIYI